MKTAAAAALALLVAALPAARATAEEKPKPPEVVTDTLKVPGTTAEFKMVKLPAGKITLKDKDGNDKEVAIKPVWISQTEVTWDTYDIYYLALDLPKEQRAGVTSDKDVIRSRPSKPYSTPDRGWGHHGSPAGSIFCREAKRYCDWLSQTTGKKYRLPTEAEWEYACRAGAPAPLKPDKDQLKEVAWFEDNSEDQTQPVGKKKPNAWGLHDMLGNVAEWVTTLDDGEAVAGGAYNDPAEDVHSAARTPFTPNWQRTDPQTPKAKSWLSDGAHVGFRVVRED
jgi:formylglycine-generating enzyme required for sulfatase activity